MIIVCDSSSLISLAETCNIDCLRYLTEKTRAEFVIPPSVTREIVDRPIQLKEYAFSAIRLKKQLDDRVITERPLKNQSAYQQILNYSNSVYSVNRTPLKIMHPGETECLALYKELNAAAVLIDEKTARLLVESPQKLQDSLQSEYRGGVQLNANALGQLSSLISGVNVLRSSEALEIAAEKGFYEGYKDKNAAKNAALYALRRSGCSITTSELDEYSSL